MNAKPVFIICPRCELNYIKEEDQYCNVCKSEMGLLDKSFLIPEEDDEEIGEILCPICHINYINEDEDMCPSCRKKKDIPKEDDDDSWVNFVDPEEDLMPDEIEISLELAAEEEEKEEEEDFSNQYKEPDDFNYDVDLSDFDIDDDEEEDDDEEDDDEE